MVRPISVLTLAILTVTIVGCGGGSGGGQQASGQQQGEGEQQEALTLGVSFDVLNEIRQAEIDAIRAAAEERGDKVEFVVANDDPQRQASQIQDLISAQQVDAVIAIAQNRDQIVSSIRAANRAEVPFIAIDRAPAEGGEVAFQITGDPVADGRIVGEEMVRRREDLKVLHLLGALTDANATGRRDGFNEAIENSSVEVVQEAPTEWDPQRALDATSNALEGNPDINAIFVPSDFLLPSVLSALEQTGRNPEDLTIITIDGDPAGCQAVKDRKIDADVATLVEQFGTQAVDAAHKAVNGEEIPEPVVQIPGLLLTQENFEERRSRVWGCADVE
jgi:ABC-type sugar transport system substrate-binding protein